MKASTNTHVTNLGVTHKIDGVVIDITDSAMQAQTRRALERKYEDRRIVNAAKAMLHRGTPPERVLGYIEAWVTTSRLNDVVVA